MKTLQDDNIGQGSMKREGGQGKKGKKDVSRR